MAHSDGMQLLTQINDVVILSGREVVGGWVVLGNDVVSPGGGWWWVVFSSGWGSM